MGPGLCTARKPGAGERPATDYDLKACTNGNCDRRAAYLTAATDMLIEDLGVDDGAVGRRRAKHESFIMQDDKAGLTATFTGLGSLSYGELAGERMKLGLDHSRSRGGARLLLRQHAQLASRRRDRHPQRLSRAATRGRTAARFQGRRVSDIVRDKSPDIDVRVRTALDFTDRARWTRWSREPKRVEAYDQMIGPNNPDGAAVVQAGIDALIAQTKELERAITVLNLKDIKFEGSDSLDQPDKLGDR